MGRLIELARIESTSISSDRSTPLYDRVYCLSYVEGSSRLRYRASMRDKDLPVNAGLAVAILLERTTESHKGFVETAQGLL